MTGWREAVDAARDEARRARAEAKRLRDEARKLEREMRDLGRDERRKAREERRSRSNEDPPGSSGATTSRDIDFSGVRDVHIHQTAGNLVVRPRGENETTAVTATGNRTPPELEVSRDGASLRIDVRLARGWLFRRRHGARTVVLLPAGASFELLQVDGGYGNLQVSEAQAESLKLRLGAGETTVSRCHGSLDADVGAGRITVSDHAGLVRCNTGTGDLSVDVRETAPGDYRLDVGLGRVELQLPPGESAQIEANSGIGRRRVDYPAAGPDAPIRVRISTGVGEAVVRERPTAARGSTARPSPSRPRKAARQSKLESDELRILQLLEQGKIPSQEAAELIAALHGAQMPGRPGGDDNDEDDALFLDDDTEDDDAPHPADAIGDQPDAERPGG